MGQDKLICQSSSICNLAYLLFLDAHRKLCCTDVGVGTSAVRDLAWRRERTRCDITWITCWTSSFTRFFRTRPHM
ncbi:unnamed protein product [Pleuronectes platessa]|uniref:Uncharacterized protein n=1 Tax=Pleuronectes platessa TaxID=8262 RepID=A0A9N7Y4T6_PLEPL|nr:unnamed protein product [Pleuronectes platessa]